MSARPDIHLYSFDMGAKDYSFPVAKFMWVDTTNHLSAMGTCMCG